MTAGDRGLALVANVGAFAMLFTSDVHAYLDPGAGSLAFQVIIATLAAVAYGARSYWGRLKGVFTRRPPGSAAESQPGPDDRNV